MAAKRVKQWLLVPAVLGGLVVMLAAVGLTLPEAHVARSRARYRASPETVWALVSELEGWGSWQKGITRVERLPDHDGHPVFRTDGDDGPITFEIDEATPPRRMVTRIADLDLPFGGTWTYELSGAEGGGTELTITEHGQVKNPVFRFASRFVLGHHYTMNAQLRALGDKLGDPVVPAELPGETAQ